MTSNGKEAFQNKFLTHVLQTKPRIYFINKSRQFQIPWSHSESIKGGNAELLLSEDSNISKLEKKKQYEKSNFYKIISHRNLDKNSKQVIENPS